MQATVPTVVVVQSSLFADDRQRVIAPLVLHSATSASVHTSLVQEDKSVRRSCALR